MLFPQLLHRIPLSALGALLISVGYALADPGQLLHVAKIGRDHMAAFLTTLVITAASDLLIVVAAGIVVELVFNLLHGASLRGLFRVSADEARANGTLTLRIKGPLVFTNLLSLCKRLAAVQTEANVYLDQSQTTVVDHTVLEYVRRVQQEAEGHGRHFEISFSAVHRPVSRHPLAARRRVRTA